MHAGNRWILSKRLSSLINTKDGIQTGIAALSQSTEDMQDAMKDTKDTATVTVSQLEALLLESEKKIPELQELMQQITEISGKSVDETEMAARHLVEILSPHIDEAKNAATRLLDALEQVPLEATPQAPAMEEPVAPKQTDDVPTATEVEPKPQPSRNRIVDGGLDIEFVDDDNDEQAA